MSEPSRTSSESPYEANIGLARAVRAVEHVFVSGAAPIWSDGSCPEDVGAQVRRCLEIIAAALADLGATLGDVVRTRMFLTSEADASAVGAVHGELFGRAPASTPPESRWQGAWRRRLRGA